MKLIRTTRILLILNALIWLGFGVYAIGWLSPIYFDHPLLTWIFGILLVGNASAMLLSSFLLGKRGKWSYYFAFAILVANIFAALMDQLGFWDIVYLLFEVALLVTLISTRKYYSEIPA